MNPMWQFVRGKHRSILDWRTELHWAPMKEVGPESREPGEES